MNIYIDFDDCLCETGRFYSEFVGKLFGKSIPYEDMNFFNMQKSFSLSDEQYEKMMTEGHKAEMLLSYKETPGAADTIKDWVEDGHDVFIITGRPYSTYEASRTWLDRHGFKKVKLYCLNKYGRDTFYESEAFSLELEDYYRIRFDYIIEDSPEAFRFFEHLPEAKVLVFDRPWNRDCVFPNDNYIRCSDWKSIRDLV
ncbi:MAG: 2-dehydropantoate 2-reductase [Eubacterium sp.]|nr:2-dehydropantoate 2-reductase [Eubacterium sp.]